jgi:hypothetical protein
MGLDWRAGQSIRAVMGWGRGDVSAPSGVHMDYYIQNYINHKRHPRSTFSPARSTSSPPATPSFTPPSLQPTRNHALPLRSAPLPRAPHPRPPHLRRSNRGSRLRRPVRLDMLYQRAGSQRARRGVQVLQLEQPGRQLDVPAQVQQLRGL